MNMRATQAIIKITEKHVSGFPVCQIRIMFHHSQRKSTGMNMTVRNLKRLIMLTKSLHSVRGLGKWASAVDAARSTRLKARKKTPSQGMSLLSEKELASDSGKSAAVHFVHMDLASFSDGTSESDYDLTVARTVKKLAVAGGDVPALKQEKETRSSGGIPSR